MSPTNNAAWLKEAGKPLVVEPAPYTEPGENEIVVRARAVSVNPLDHGMSTTGRLVKQFPAIIGHDVAGVVAAIGLNVTTFAVGDRVLADSRAAMVGKPAYGCFQEYIVIPLPTVAKIPEAISFEEAIVLPLPVDTASAMLFQQDRLALAMPPTTGGTGKTLLIWGGSAAVGCSAVQLAAAAGYEVIATASPRNHDLVRSLGAATVLDYNSPSIVDELVEAVKGKDVVGAVSCIKGKEIHHTLCQVLARTEGSKRFVASVDPFAKDHAIEDVTCMSVFATTVAMNEVGPHIWGKFLPEALASGKFACKPEPIVAGEGLESVQGAIDLWAKGVSAQKVVIKL